MQQVDEHVLKAFFVSSTPQDVIRIMNSEVHFDFVAAKGLCQVLLDGDLGESDPPAAGQAGKGAGFVAPHRELLPRRPGSRDRAPHLVQDLRPGAGTGPARCSLKL